MTDVGDEKQVTHRKSAAKLQQDEVDARFIDVMSTYNGRAVLWGVMSDCGVTRAAPPGTEAMTRFEGRRDVGLEVLEKIMRLTPEFYPIMGNEAVSRDAKTGGKTNG